MSENIVLESAAAVLGVAPELPQATPGSLDHQAVVPDAPPAAPAPAAPPLLDRTGTAWDPKVHESPARLNEKKKWACRRGNAARIARGLPPSGAKVGGRNPPSDAPAPAAPPPEYPQPSASIPPPEIAAGAAEGGPPIVDGVPAPLPQTPLEAYATTAAALNDGLFGAATITIGPAWDQSTAERSKFVDCWQRVLFWLQAPVLNPLVELLMLFGSAIYKRRNDPDTRTVGKKLWDWLRGAKPPAPAIVDPYTADRPGPGTSAAATASAPPPSGESPRPQRKLAWAP